MSPRVDGFGNVLQMCPDLVADKKPDREPTQRQAQCEMQSNEMQEREAPGQRKQQGDESWNEQQGDQSVVPRPRHRPAA